MVFSTVSVKSLLPAFLLLLLLVGWFLLCFNEAGFRLLLTTTKDETETAAALLMNVLRCGLGRRQRRSGAHLKKTPSFHPNSQWLLGSCEGGCVMWRDQ